MTTQTLGTNRILELNGYEYPLRHRVNKPTNLPQPFQSILEGIRKQLPFAQLTKPASDERMAQAFTASLAVLQERYAEWNNMLLWIVKTALDIRLQMPNPSLAADLAQKKMAELRPMIPVLVLEKPAFYNWNLFALPDEQIYDTMADYFRNATAVMVNAFVQSLDELTARRAVGLIAWKEKSGVCRYEFYRWVVIYEHLGTNVVTSTRETPEVKTITGNYWETVSETWQKTTTTHHLQRTHRNARHEHQLVEAKEYRSDGDYPRKPRFVQGLLLNIPPWVRDKYVKIVAGTMVKEHIVEVDTCVENWTEKEEEEIKIGEVRRSGILISPSVTLGHFSLSGWSGMDLEREAKIQRL